MSKLVGIYKYFFTHVSSRPNVVNRQFTLSVFHIVHLPVRYCNCQHVNYSCNMSFNQLRNYIRLFAFVIKHYRPLLYLFRKSLAICGLISAMSLRYPSKNLFFFSNNIPARTKLPMLFWLSASYVYPSKINMAKRISVAQ